MRDLSKLLRSGLAVLGTTVALQLSSTGMTLAEKGPASKPVDVVELFTSQGCSSCPPADELLGKLAKRKNILALTLPVDYWDYLGWKDTLASPAYSSRQRTYARARGDRAVYTPQVVVNGIAHAVGSRPNEIENALKFTDRKLGDMRVPVKLWTEDDAVMVEVDAAKDASDKHPGTLWLLLVRKKETVSIKRGENTGRTITYYNVVRQMTPVGQWEGKRITLKLPKHDLMQKGIDTCVVLLQKGTGGPIVGAAQLAGW